MSAHHSKVVEGNCRPGPGRGPAPAPGPDRWWWKRWCMFDGMLHDALDALDAAHTVTLRHHWPAGWPTPESGLLSIRQMEWVRVVMVEGRALNLRDRGFQ